MTDEYFMSLDVKEVLWFVNQHGTTNLISSSTAEGSGPNSRGVRGILKYSNSRVTNPSSNVSQRYGIWPSAELSVNQKLKFSEQSIGDRWMSEIRDDNLI